jgi:hypothetical protein
VPWAVWGFFKLITPFIDPLTREKLKFNEDLRQYIPPVQLSKTHGGDCDFQYKHDVYWPALQEQAGKRRQTQFERWEKAGKRIGEREAYLKDEEGKELSISQLEEEKAAKEKAANEKAAEEKAIKEKEAEEKAAADKAAAEKAAAEKAKADAAAGIEQKPLAPEDRAMSDTMQML